MTEHEHEMASAAEDEATRIEEDAAEAAQDDECPACGNVSAGMCC